MTVLHAFEHGIPPERVDPPAAAVEYARRLAQRGVPIVVLIRSYRVGHGRFLTRCMQAHRPVRGHGAVLAIVVRMTELSFRYIYAVRTGNAPRIMAGLRNLVGGRQGV